MLIIYYLCLKQPIGLLIAYILQAVPYCLLMKKLGERTWLGLLPNVAEYKLSRKVFKKRSAFFQPFIIAAILIGYAYYVDPHKGVGIFYVICAFIIWGIFLAVLYVRLCKAFGKKNGFGFGSVILPPVFLTILARSSAEYAAPVFKPEKERKKAAVVFGKIMHVILSACVLLVIIAGCGFLAIKAHTPVILVKALMEDAEAHFTGVEATGETVTRAEVLGADLDAVMEANQTRDYYFTDHSSDKDVTVFMYIIGSDLEDLNGLASDNIIQMIAATKQGSALRFIIQAGGSNRWFTSGIKDGSYGRYEIANGKLTQIEELSGDMNMADPQNLTDFLTWANNSYDSDRSMFVLWDHGGGIEGGYGKDEINGTSESILVSDLAECLEKSGSKFDFIGFDACLMQEIEAAAAIAPYADYYIASEETEAGYGWYYTVPFGALAQNPGMSDEEFADILISSYDPYNIATDTDGSYTSATLSVIDLTMIESAYQNLSAFMASAADKMANDPACFADISLAASDSYSFYADVQLDLLDFLGKLEEIDFDRTVVSQDEMDSLTQSIEASIVCRNGASVSGINGIAFACPYKAINYYGKTSKHLAALSCDNEKEALDTMFSIMAAQQMKQGDAMSELANSNALLSMIMEMSGASRGYADEDWYIEGFEDYDNVTEFTNLPLMESADGDGYAVDLPDETWAIITDVQTMVYQQVSADGSRRYIGNDYLGGADANGHTLITPDDYWPTIGGQLVCYEADEVQIAEDGTEIYTGKIKARLNGDEDVYLLVQWDEEKEGQAMTAKILGYQEIEDEETLSLFDKGYPQFTSGDSVQFLFDYYDAEGNFIKTDVSGSKVRITDLDKFIVTDAPMDPCTVEFGGILHDVYGRVLTTEMLEVEITK